MDDSVPILVRRLETGRLHFKLEPIIRRHVELAQADTFLYKKGNGVCTVACAWCGGRFQNGKLRGEADNICPVCVPPAGAIEDLGSNRAYRILTEHGIPWPCYEQLWLDTDECCWACGKHTPLFGKRAINVDHSHLCCKPSGKKREKYNRCGLCFSGLLCSRCNNVVGGFDNMTRDHMRYLAINSPDRYRVAMQKMVAVSAEIPEMWDYLNELITDTELSDRQAEMCHS